MKTVVVIGSGNVAEALAGAIAASPYGLAQLYARNRDRGERIARSYGCPFASDPQELASADIYLIAVSDRAVGEVAEALDFGRAVVAHTAGSVPLDGLPGKIRNRGVFYPLQTFTAGRHISLGDVPLLVEGSDPQTTRTLLRMARALSSRARQAFVGGTGETTSGGRLRKQFLEPHVRDRPAVARPVRTSGRSAEAPDARDGRQGARKRFGSGRADRSGPPRRHADAETPSRHAGRLS